MFSFLWKGKDKIKSLALISEYEDGGLKMPHVESGIEAQRIICLKKYTENYCSPWKLILSRLLTDHGGKFLLHCNYDVADLPKHLPKCVLKLGLLSMLNKYPRATTSWIKYCGIINICVSMANLNFVKSHIWLES